MDSIFGRTLNPSVLQAAERRDREMLEREIFGDTLDNINESLQKAVRQIPAVEQAVIALRGYEQREGESARLREVQNRVWPRTKGDR